LTRTGNTRGEWGGMERRFRRDFAALEEISEWVSGFLAENSLDPANEFALNLIIEELFTNLVKYNADGRLPIAIDLARDGDHVVITITDRQVEGFDITKAPPVDIDRADERTEGGRARHSSGEKAGGQRVLRACGRR